MVVLRGREGQRMMEGGVGWDIEAVGLFLHG